jgi:hypothetical protein
VLLPQFENLSREDDPPVGSEQDPPVVVLVITPVRQEGFLPAVKFDVFRELDIPHNEDRQTLGCAVSFWGSVDVSVTPSGEIDQPSK